MRRSVAVGLCLFVMMSVCSVQSWAQKIEVDPNTPEAAVENKVDDSTVDERLAQKVTYTATGKRLHTVLEELSIMTGVTINCGSGEKDWGVRDLPVIVCCKDFALGKLLNAITETTHTALSSYMVDDIRSYRLRWGKSRQKKLEDFYKAKYDASLERANWEWDSWVAYGSVPDSELGKDATSDWMRSRPEYPLGRLFAKIMAALGPEDKQKVFAGDKVVISASDSASPLAKQVAEMYRGLLDQQRKEMTVVSYDVSETGERTQVESDPDNMFGREDQSDKAVLEISLSKGEFPELLSTLIGPFVGTAKVAQNPTLHYNKLPDPPKIPDYPPSEQLGSMQGLRDLMYEAEAKWPDSLKEEVELKKPQDKKEIVFSDRVQALAEASGYAIVCEDFLSHKIDRSTDDSMFGNKLPLLAAIKKLRYSINSMDFYIDTSDRLLLGFPLDWYEFHSGLVSEEYLSSIRKKMDGDGLQLDDALSILRLTPRQYTQWIEDNVEIGTLGDAVSRETKWYWLLYDALSDQDKAQAKSEEGLALSKFDPQYMIDFSRRVSEGTHDSPKLGPIFHNVNDDTDIDPSAICRMTLRVVADDVDDRMPMSLTGMQELLAGRKPSGGLPKQYYRIELTDEDSKRELDGLRWYFPIYSKEREKQLVELQKATHSGDKQK